MTIDRRQMLAGTAATAAALAGTAGAQEEDTAPDLSGKSVLITGTSSGFGRLAAEHCASLGAKVFATMRNLPRPEAEELRDVASREGYDLEVIEIDVTSDREVREGVEKALSMNGGRLDVLVNNAGIAYGGTVEMQDMKATRNIFDTNVFGPQRMARAVLPAMRAQGGGHIVQISSQLGRVIVPGFGLYPPTKFALEAMSEQMAYEIAPQGIDVTIVEPGGYPTEIWENARILTEALLERTPMDLKEQYAMYIEALETRGGGNTDPMDVPRAVAALIAMPAGERPLRRPVHPGPKPQEAINQVSARVQKAILERSGMGALAEAVYPG